MFRSKVLPVLQNITNKNSYNIERIRLFQHTLFSTDTRDLDETLKSNSDITSTVTSYEKKSKNFTKQNNELVKKLNDVSAESSNTSDDENHEVDKLYKKIEIEVRGNDRAVLKSYGEFAVMAANHLDITVNRNIELRKPIHERLTVLKSIHVHKNHRVQYETRTYYRYVDFLHLTGSTADTYLEYIQRNLPEGVAMKVTKVELQTLPDTVVQAMSPE
ncbi:PREDICTED: 28S ribosomal protein S10, mitochondrial [Eufriesea mexicana]|uniref:28S ribosomal protein S10, mitochondrial n=1 Tax=Eufriesea mexicana TaxID=516756 RepID=UPI00083C2958|nr:PREDICTED: 28S ribosomal protein S10, mitochondrial [Eufriesea mexicana]